MSFYKTQKWKRKRAVILRRDKYLCQEAKRYGKIVEANTVHHIFPLKEFPELALVNWNLISLSPDNHNKLENRLTGELTGLGLAWQDRRRIEFEKFYADNNQPPTSS